VVWLVVLPVAVGAAILRYRLYDLDRIISRTLAYGLLTLVLGGGYALVVLGLGQLVGRNSPLVAGLRHSAVMSGSSVCQAEDGKRAGGVAAGMSQRGGEVGVAGQA